MANDLISLRSAHLPSVDPEPRRRGRAGSRARRVAAWLAVPTAV